MFSQVCVNLLNGVSLVPCSFPGGGHLWYQVPSGGGGYVWGGMSGGGMGMSRGVSSHPNTTPYPRNGTWDTTGYSWKVGGMHPNEMFSCFQNIL